MARTSPAITSPTDWDLFAGSRPTRNKHFEVLPGKALIIGEMKSSRPFLRVLRLGSGFRGAGRHDGER